jgi:DNA polymerase-4
LRKEGLAGRTVTLKERFADVTGRTRSNTHPQAVDGTAAITRAARRLLTEVDTLTWSTAGGIRLLGVGVSGLADWFQPDLIAAGDDDVPTPQPDTPATVPEPAEPRPHWRPGADVRHAEYGAGWVWGSGRGRVTVRFEGPGTPPGPVRTFAEDDEQLSPAEPPASARSDGH